MARRSEISRRNEEEPRFKKERRRLGLRLRQLRDERALTQETAAEAIGLHPIHLGRIEGGQENVTLATLIAISEAYSVPLRGFFEDGPSTGAEGAAHKASSGDKKVRTRRRTASR